MSNTLYVLATYYFLPSSNERITFMMNKMIELRLTVPIKTKCRKYQTLLIAKKQSKDNIYIQLLPK